MNSDTNSIYKFSADRPWESGDKDLLNRYEFAEELANAIQSWSEKDSLVIGINGEWGGGKTSLKNMVKDVIEDRELRIETLEFTPWQFAGQQKIAKSFFQELSICLGNTELFKEEDHQEWADYFKEIAHRFDVGYEVVGGMKNTVKILSVSILSLTAFLGLSISFELPSWLSYTILGVSVLLISGAALLSFSKNVAKKLAEWMEVKSELEEKSLTELKDNMKDYLGDLDEPILIILDDIDRLTPKETHMIFQLIKANADFPNLIYLVLFQKDIVAEHLSTVEKNKGIDGSDFLEKIVQVPFDIPQIKDEQIDRVFFNELEQCLTEGQLSYFDEEKRWGNFYYSGIKPYLNNLRDVHRIISTFAFHNNLLVNEGISEINPIDLVGLEILRNFESDVYERLPDFEEILTGQVKLRSQRSEELEEKMQQDLLNSANDDNEDIVQELLKELFPPAETLLNGSSYASSYEEKWSRNLRVCHEDHFHKYFHFSVSENEISQARIDSILNLTGDKEELRSELLQLKEEGLLKVALERLEPYKQDIPIESAEDFITALFDIGDIIPPEKGSFLSISPVMHASRIIHWYLKQLNDNERIKDILITCVSETDGLYLPVYKISGEEGDEKEREAEPDAYLLNEDQLEELKELCLEKIIEKSETGELSNHPDKLIFVLYRWQEWGSEEEVIDWVDSLTQSREGILVFLDALVSKVRTHTMGDKVAQIKSKIDVETVENFIDPDELAQRVREVDRDGLEDEEVELLDFYLEEIGNQ